MYKAVVDYIKGVTPSEPWPDESPKISAEITYYVTGGNYYWQASFPAVKCQLRGDNHFPSKELALENLKMTFSTLGLPYTIK